MEVSSIIEDKKNLVGWKGQEKVQGVDVVIVQHYGEGSRFGNFPLNFPISARSVIEAAALARGYR